MRKEKTLIANLRIREIGGRKFLSGQDPDDLNVVYILQRPDKRSQVYELHRVPITDQEQTVRSFVSADQSEDAEATSAVISIQSKKRRGK